MSVLEQFVTHYLMQYQATVPKVATIIPEDQHPSPNFGVVIPEHLRVAVDGLISQLQRSVMLQVKSITPLKYVKPPPKGTVLTQV